MSPAAPGSTHLLLNALRFGSCSVAVQQFSVRFVAAASSATLSPPRPLSCAEQDGNARPCLGGPYGSPVVPSSAAARRRTSYAAQRSGCCGSPPAAAVESAESATACPYAAAGKLHALPLCRPSGAVHEPQRSGS